MNNRDFLNTIVLHFSGSVEEQNKKINAYFGVNSTESIFIEVDGNAYEISTDNCEFAFINSIWENLNLEQRLRILKWQQESNLVEQGYVGKIPPFEYLSDVSEHDNDNFLATAKRRGGLIINLDAIRKRKGLDALILITHENIHYVDFERFNKVCNLCSEYFTINARTLSVNVDSIMSLPVEGKVKNYRTGNYDIVDEKMRNNFLFMKNYIMGIYETRKGVIKKQEITDKEKYETYLSYLFYYTSPLEKKAYDTSIRYVSNYVDSIRNNYPVSSIDDKTIERYQKMQKRIMGTVRQIQKYYNMSHYNAMNLELIDRYNKAIYGNDKNKYICKDLMQKREKIIKGLWERKFAYYGKYEPWEKEK